MTTPTEVKHIPTYTYIVSRVKKLLASSPLEYKKAFSVGTTKIVPGATVVLNKFSRGGIGKVKLYANDPKNSAEYRDPYAHITAHWWHGEAYTRYTIEASPSKYRKRVHKFLPVSLPEGMKSSGNRTPAIYFNADGTEAGRGQWIGSRRGYSGDPDSRTLLIRDRDGKFMNCRDKNEENEKIFHLSYQNEEVNVALMQGFIPGAVESKIDWYDSLKCPDDLPGCWDQDRVRLMAAKVHSEFLKFAKQYPHCKVALNPMTRYVKGDEGQEMISTDVQFGYGVAREPHVLGRDLKNDGPIFFYLPEITLYWFRENQGSDSLRFIRVTIPPYGSEYLKHNGYSMFAETYRWGNNTAGYARAKREGLPMESVFHTLRFKKPGVSPTWSVNQRFYGGIHKHPAEGESNAIYWPDANDMVGVLDASADSLDWYELHQGGYGCRPGDILSSMRERELIDSLPLC